jgi:hypothetical protein
VLGLSLGFKSRVKGLEGFGVFRVRLKVLGFEDRFEG